jgi:hypothetical protein
MAIRWNRLYERGYGSYFWFVSPWYTMPSGLEARRVAARAELSKSLRALRCVARLVAVEGGSTQDRELGLAMLEDIDRAEKALEIMTP